MRRLAVAILLATACGSSKPEPTAPQSINVAAASAPASALPVAAEPDPGTPAKISQAQLDAKVMHVVAEKWRVDHGDDECPSAERLKLDRELSASSSLEDPWGHRYEIRCVDFDTMVLSAGPDGQLDTSDDILAR